MDDPELLTSKQMAEKLGINASAFYWIIKQIDITPAEIRYSQWYKTKYPLWNEASFAILNQHPLVENARMRSVKYREAKEKRADMREHLYQRMYPDWRQALVPSCNAMLNLNRYAKWETCARQTKEEIYSLKTALLRTLYQNGYATEVRKHEFERAGKICWGCNGDGCDLCDNTGFYLPPDTLYFVFFRFTINGVYFSWHQPEFMIDWPIEFTSETSQSYVPDPMEKPLSMDIKDFVDAKALIRYVLEKACPESPNDPK